MPNTISKTKYLKRYREILSILIKFGFADIVDRASLKDFLPHSFEVSNDLSSYSTNERIVMAIEELGTTFVKFGQVLSNRSDVVGEDLAEELKKLQEDVKGIQAFDVIGEVEGSLNVKLEDVFQEFNIQPIASASIAQVHQATLLDGQLVAVKIRRPEVMDNVSLDLSIIRDLARVTGIESRFGRDTVRDLLNSYERSLMIELNYKKELGNINKFNHNLKNHQGVEALKVFPSLSSENILTMEFVEGRKINDLDGILEDGGDLKELSSSLIHTYFKQILDDGFFHGDPHPGNIRVKDGKIIRFMDFGGMGSVLPEDRKLFSDFMSSFISKDVKSLSQAIRKIAITHDITGKNIKEFEYRLLDIISIADQGLEDIKFDESSEELQKIMNDFEIVVPAYFHTLFRTLSLVIGNCTILNPQLNLAEDLDSFMKEILLKKIDPISKVNSMRKKMAEFDVIMDKAPEAIQTLIERFDEGDLGININLERMMEAVHKLDKMIDKLAIAIITGSILLGSSIMVKSQVPPIYNGYSLLGVIGFVIAGILGLVLVIRNIKNTW